MQRTSAHSGLPGRSRWTNKPMDLVELRRRLDRDVLLRTLGRHRDRDTRIAEWIQRLEHQHGGIEDSGARGLDRALGMATRDYEGVLGRWSFTTTGDTTLTTMSVWQVRDGT
jgi:hypothetical protein